MAIMNIFSDNNIKYISKLSPKHLNYAIKLNKKVSFLKYISYE